MAHLDTYLENTAPNRKQFVEVRLGQYAGDGFSEVKMLTRRDGLFLVNKSAGDKLYNNCRLILDLDQVSVSKKADKKLKGKEIVALGAPSEQNLALSVVVTKDSHSYRISTYQEARKLIGSLPYLTSLDGYYAVWGHFAAGNEAQTIEIAIGLLAERSVAFDLQSFFKKKEPNVLQRCYQKIAKIGLVIKQLYYKGL